MMAAQTTFENGILRIYGTEEDDVIVYVAGHDPAVVIDASQDHPPANLLINGQRFSLPGFASVRRIAVYGGAGRDRFSFVDPMSREELYFVPGKGRSASYIVQPALYVDGGGGSDIIHAGGSNRVTLCGGSGNDRVAGDDGWENLSGGRGDDTLDGGLGLDGICGGAGNDTVSYASRTEPVAIVLTNNTNLRTDPPEPSTGANGALLLDGRTSETEARGPAFIPLDDPTIGTPYASYLPPDLADYSGSGGSEGDQIASDVENAVGGSADDVIIGDRQPNILSGGDGNDRIYGGLGTDTLYGGAGNDTLCSADDRDDFPGFDTGDRVHGGAGKDVARRDSLDDLIKIERDDRLLPLSA